MTFEFNAINYEKTEKGHCYKTEAGKKIRIKADEFERTLILAEMIEAESDIAETQEAEDAKDRETEENFNKKDEPKTKKEEKLDAEMEKLGYHRINSEWNDIRYATTAHEVMAWNTVEEGLKWVKEQTKGQKASKPRRSKDIAFEMMTIDGNKTLTAKQKRFIERMQEDDFMEDGLDSELWIDVYCDTISDEFNPMSFGAMVSTLREKNIICVAETRVNGKKCKVFSLTGCGKQIAKELGLG